MSGFDNAERLALYTHLRTFESDFDKSQSQMRAICSAWSGVVVGAIAVLVTNASTPPAGMQVTELAQRAEILAYLRSVICIIGSCGVYAFWYIDQRIYQRLLHSVFAYGLYVEFKNEDLPQIRSSLFIANLDITNGLAWFYRIQFMLFPVVSGVLFVQSMVVGKAFSWGVFALVVFHLAAAALGEYRSRSWPSLAEIAKKLYPKLAEAMPERSARSGDRVSWFDLKLTFGTPAAAANPAMEDAWLARIQSAPIPPTTDTDGLAPAGSGSYRG